MKFTVLCLTAIVATGLASPAVAEHHKEKAMKSAAEQREAVHAEAEKDLVKTQKKARKLAENPAHRDAEAAKEGAKKAALQKSEHRSDEDELDARGNEMATEMTSRRDDRKAIKEEYRANREPGQEGLRGEGKPAKKPWWKFWDSDE